MNDISKAYDAFTKCFGNRRSKQAFKCVLASLSKIPDDAKVSVLKKSVTAERFLTQIISRQI